MKERGNTLLYESLIKFIVNGAARTLYTRLSCFNMMSLWYDIRGNLLNTVNRVNTSYYNMKLVLSCCFILIVSLLSTDDETAREDWYIHIIHMIFHLKFSPEALGDVGILFFLLDHQASLPPEGNHGGHDGELVDVGVEVVQPELVHRQEGSGSSHTSTAVHQDCPWGFSLQFY